MNWILARMPSECALCHDRVAVGDRITKYGSAWVHLGCAEADHRRIWSRD